MIPPPPPPMMTPPPPPPPPITSVPEPTFTKPAPLYSPLTERLPQAAPATSEIHAANKRKRRPGRNIRPGGERVPDRLQGKVCRKTRKELPSNLPRREMRSVIRSPHSWLFGSALFILLFVSRGIAPAVESRAELFEGKRMVVTEVDLAKDRLQLFLNDDRGQPFKRFARLSAWLSERKLGLRWAMNGGMYHRDYSAVGLFVADGKAQFPLNLAAGEGNFFLKPNAVWFLTAQGAQILRSEDYAAAKPAALLATQSGPALVLRGQLHPAFRAGSMNRLHRNGVGVASPQKVFFAISDDPVNFDEFARFFRDRLHCADALFLDGTVSSLHDSALKRSDEKIDLGPIFAITEVLSP
jgi:uncharacterized protein YigE (DUF2233 family)